MFNKNRFLAVLKERGISVKALAEAIGISPASLYGRIRGETQFYNGEIASIAVAVPLTDSQIISIFFDRELNKC